MRAFEWSEDCSVPIPRVDAEHRQIIELLGILRTRTFGGGATQKLVADAVEQLSRYADRHLRREELLLRIRGYPRYPEHKAEHDDYRAKVGLLREQLARRDVGVRVSNFVSAWWRHHILTSDLDYARYFLRLLK